MTGRWHAFTCHTCGSVLASALLPPGCNATGLYLEALRTAHRVMDRCAATRISLAPCSQEEVVARLLADRDAEALS